MGSNADTEPVPYSEDNPDHVPNPLYQSGVVDTTGTMGDTGNQITNISPVFDQAKADAFGKSAEALDDPDQDSDEHVVLPEEELSREEAADKVREVAAETEGDRSADYANANASDDNGDGELHFSSKKEAKEYADAHGLDVDDSLYADDYKAAVAEAAHSK